MHWKKHKGQTKDVSDWSDVFKKVDTDDGDKILDHAFGDKDKVVDQIVAQTGISKSEAAKVQASMAPMILGMLADKKDADGLDADGVAKQTDIFSNKLKETATSNFDITDLFPKQSGTTTPSATGGLGWYFGKHFGEPVLIKD